VASGAPLQIRTWIKGWPPRVEAYILDLHEKSGIGVLVGLSGGLWLRHEKNT
jgi:hypothetical protein